MNQRQRPAALALEFALAAYAVLSLLSMATMSIGAALVVAALAWVALTERQRLAEAWRRLLDGRGARAFLLAAFALAAACAFSLVYAQLSPLTYGEKYAVPQWTRELGKLWYLFWPFFLALGLALIPEAARTKVLRGWLAAFVLLGAIGVAQFFTGWPRPQPIPGYDGRFHATLFLGHHLSVASVFLFPFFAALDQLFAARRPVLPRWVLALGVALGLATFFATYSRMLWGALPIGLAIWGLWVLPKKGKVVFAFLLTAGLALALSLPQVQSRLRTGMGIQERTALWSANLQFFADRPLAGTGFRLNEQTAAYYFWATDPSHPDVFIGHAHNNLLEMLGGTGAPGTLAWLLWNALALLLVWRVARGGAQHAGEVNFARGLLCAWIVFHLNGLTQVNFWEGKVLHQGSWALAWVLLWGAREKKALSS